MPASLRPRRSVLYVPGSNVRALDKARQLAADSYIFDLEDAVAPDQKEPARENVAQALASGGYGRRELLVRVNGLETSCGPTDLTAAVRMPIDGVVLPKVERATMVHEAEAVLAEAGANEQLAIWCMIETPRGVLHVEEIATASKRIGGLIMGTSDLTKDLRARQRRDRLPLLTALGHCLLAARAAGLPILDGVCLDLSDDDAFLAECWQGRELGFDGKTLIHPKTIAAANAVFAPSVEDIAWSRRIIAAHEEAVAAGSGVTLVDGQLIENLHVEEARRVVTLAAAISALHAG